jgi:hypothetical protein
MEQLFLAAAVLACPVGMGLMMWMMMRGHNNTADSSSGDQQHKVDQLRAEIEALKAQRSRDHTTGGH